MADVLRRPAKGGWKPDVWFLRPIATPFHSNQRLAESGRMPRRTPRMTADARLVRNARRYHADQTLLGHGTGV
jgi:hypothetical protein